MGGALFFVRGWFNDFTFNFNFGQNFVDTIVRMPRSFELETSVFIEIFLTNAIPLTRHRTRILFI